MSVWATSNPSLVGLGTLVAAAIGAREAGKAFRFRADEFSLLSRDAQADELWPVCMTGYEAIEAAGRGSLALRWCWGVGLTLLSSNIVCSGP